MKKEFTLAVVSGVEGPSVYLDDYRICGRKPWGGGTTLHSFTVRLEDLRAALPKNMQIIKKEKTNAPTS